MFNLIITKKMKAKSKRAEMLEKLKELVSDRIIWLPVSQVDGFILFCNDRNVFPYSGMIDAETCEQFISV